MNIISLAALATFTFSTIPGIYAENISIKNYGLAVETCAAKIPYQKGSELKIVLDENANAGSVIIPNNAFKNLKEDQSIQLTFDFDGVRYVLNAMTAHFSHEPTITTKVSPNILYELSNSQLLKIFYNNNLISSTSLDGSFEIIKDMKMCRNGT